MVGMTFLYKKLQVIENTKYSNNCRACERNRKSGENANPAVPAVDNYVTSKTTQIILKPNIEINVQIIIFQ